MADKGISVKTKFGDDIRRFTLHQPTFQNLCENIDKLYNLAQPYKIKYEDDENDLITISATIDLVEGVRVASSQKPPILRIMIFGSINPETKPKIEPVLNVCEQIIDTKLEVCEQKTDTKLEACEQITNTQLEKEYPALPVDQWEPRKKDYIVQQPKIAIVKKESKIEPTAKVEHEKTKTIAQMARDISAATSQSVISSSSSTTFDTNKESKNIIDTLANDRDENNLLCFNLSKQIAEDCSALSRTTSDLCEAVSKVTREDTLSKDVVKQVENLSNSTLDIVGRLSKETALMCSEFSTAAIVISQTLEEQKKTAEQLKKQSDDLQKLSKSVYDSSVLESNATLQTIKNL